MIDVHSTYGDNHFTMDVSHIIEFYTFNMYSAICQLYINKAERKKRETIQSTLPSTAKEAQISHILIQCICSLGSQVKFFKNFIYLCFSWSIVDLQCCVILGVQQSDSVIRVYKCLFSFSFFSIIGIGSNGKESTGNAGDQGLIPGSGRLPGEGISHPLQYSCLENSMGRGAW